MVPDIGCSPVSPPDPGCSPPNGYPSPTESVTLQTPFLGHTRPHTTRSHKILPALPQLFTQSPLAGILQDENLVLFPVVSNPADFGSPIKADSYQDRFVAPPSFSDVPGLGNQFNYDLPVPADPPPSRNLESLCDSDGNLHRDSTDASLYSSQFPAGHRLNPYFVHTYQLGDELGSGGYGFVMTACHYSEGREVAVKFIIKDKVPEHAWMEDETVGRLPTEVMLLSFIDHDNIVRCLDLFEDSLYFYLVQELHGSPWPKARRCPIRLISPSTSCVSHAPSTPSLSPSGSASSSTSSLARSTPPLSSSDIQTRFHDKDRTPNILYSDSSTFHVSRPEYSPMTKPRPEFSRRPSYDLFECIEQSEHKRLSEDQARYVFSQVVDAVYYLDSQGVTHRDIKDENIVINKDFKVKLIDFGSAAVVDPKEPRPYYTLFFGTTAYASSEILLKKSYQAAPAEVWTLGVLLSYLLTGTSPFPTVKDAINGRIVLADTPGARLSRTPMSLLRRCLDPNPQTRATISEVKAHRWLTQAYDNVSDWPTM